jgi:hypothetical protein
MRLLAALALALPLCGLAAEPSARSLERLLEVTQAQRLVESVRKQVDGMMGPMFEQALGNSQLTPGQQREAQAHFRRYTERFNGILDEELSWARLKDMQMQVYRESFTQEEIDGLIAFYESPAGKVFVEKMPQVMQRSMALMQQRMGPILLRVEAVARETAAELRAQKAQ